MQYGVSYSDAKAIAMDVFRENFSKLSQNAYRVATGRAEEFAENYLKELHDREPGSIRNIEDPGIQSDILEAQAGFARSGDRDLREVLTDLLVDRTARPERTIVSLTLSAAIQTAQRLTDVHFAALSSVFAFQQLKFPRMTHHEQVYENLVRCLVPFTRQMNALKDADVHYLEALGCVTLGGGNRLLEFLWETYPGLFAEPIDVNDFPVDLEGKPLAGPHHILKKLKNTSAVMASPRDPGKFQVSATDRDDLHQLLIDHDLLDHESELESALRKKLSGQRVCQEIADYSEDLDSVRYWNETLGLSHRANTAVGTAIGHANISRVTKGELVGTLDFWLS
ncbi:LPO_1073/Vpar_1526 family protein [Streptomyces sp. NPDC051907]|uniref:LPO_1073/Vpar_1526 family protein n=1 Tax=Streptomyces sp. NPDC051907 TaxID=3155284 RepID=UPI003425965E